MIPKEIYEKSITEESKKYVEQLCFIDDKIPQKIDMLFVFGSTKITQIVDAIKNVAQDATIKKICISGGINKKRKHLLNEVAEALQIKEKLTFLKNIDIFYETHSTNTFENVENLYNLLEDKNPDNIVYISKSYASGRCYLTLKKFFDVKDIYSKPYECNGVSINNWFDNEKSKAFVLGEAERIKSYIKKGDLYTDKSIAKLLENINIFDL